MLARPCRTRGTLNRHRQRVDPEQRGGSLRGGPPWRSRAILMLRCSDSQGFPADDRSSYLSSLGPLVLRRGGDGRPPRPRLERRLPLNLVPASKRVDPGPGDPVGTGHLAHRPLLENDSSDDKLDFRHPGRLWPGCSACPATRRRPCADQLLGGQFWMTRDTGPRCPETRHYTCYTSQKGPYSLDSSRAIFRGGR
jgi:hypothetical protein